MQKGENITKYLERRDTRTRQRQATTAMESVTWIECQLQENSLGQNATWKNVSKPNPPRGFEIEM